MLCQNLDSLGGSKGGARKGYIVLISGHLFI